MKDDKARDEHDRLIERSVQPKLVQEVARRLIAETSFDLRNELEFLASIVRSTI